MAKSINIEIPLVRKSIREALNLQPGYGKSEAMLLRMVSRLMGYDVPLQTLRDQIEWNLTERYVFSRTNRDTDEIEWFITKEGIAHDNI
jgi:hypothetical protein